MLWRLIPIRMYGFAASEPCVDVRTNGSQTTGTGELHVWGADSGK